MTELFMKPLSLTEISGRELWVVDNPFLYYIQIYSKLLLRHWELIRKNYDPTCQNINEYC